MEDRQGAGGARGIGMGLVFHGVIEALQTYGVIAATNP